MRQVEVSRTIVFAQPRHARGFFEALVADNLDIGRPEQVELIFAGRRVRPGRPPATPEVFKTKVVTRGVEVTVNAFYQHSRIKQYLKYGRALRVETVINDTYDLGVQRRLHNLPELQTRARAVNRRLLDTERVGQGCVLASPAFGTPWPYLRPPRRAQPCGWAAPGSKPCASSPCRRRHQVRNPPGLWPNG